MNNTNFIPSQSVFSNGQITGNSWGTPQNIFVVDGDYATSNVNTGTASDFIIENFNFNLPQNAVPTGIEIEIIGLRGAQTSPVISLDVSAYDNTNGANNFYPYTAPITSLTPTLSTITIGGQNYMFATAFTVDQINNLKIALTANGNISLDCVLARVFYFLQTPPTPSPVTPGVCIDCSSPIQVQAMYLELPFLIGQTKFYLKKGSFSYPDGTPVQPGDIGSCGGTIPWVFDESKRKQDGQNFEENAMLDTNNGGTWTVLSSGVIEVDLGFVTQRGLDFKTPGTHIASLMSDHDANSKVIISNNEPYNLTLVRQCQADSVFSPPIIVENQDVPLAGTLHDLDLRGAGVSTINDPLDPHRKIVTIPGSGGTTPAVIISTISGTSGGVQVPSLTANIIISGLNRGVVIQVSTEEAAAISAITVGGIPATRYAASTDIAHNLRQESWFCPNPPLGTQPIIVSVTPNAYITFGAECVNGVDPISPVGATQTASGNNNNPTLVLNTTVDYSIVIDGLCTAQTPILYTPGAGQAGNWAETANADLRQGGSSVENAGLQPDAITMDYSITQSTPWVYTAIEIVGITSLSPTADHKVAVDGTDALPDFLDPKIEIVSGDGSVTIVKTIQNPGGNEKISYDLSVSGGGGGNSIIDQAPLGAGSTYGLVSGLIDSSNTTYVVSHGEYAPSTLLVVVNGVELQQGTAPAEWVETDPTTGTFDLNTPLNPGDIITTLYQTTSTISQTGIQFEDETGSPLGTPGTVDEFEVTDDTGIQVTATRVGNKVQYKIKNTGSTGGGSGSGDQLLGVLRYQAQTGYKNNPISFITNPTGDVAFLMILQDSGSGNVIIWRLQKDPNTGMFYKTHEQDAGIGGSQQGTSNYGLAIIGSFLYLASRTGASGNVISIRRYLAVDLTGQTTITGAQNATGGGAGVFSDGTDLYINSGSNTFKQYSISGTVATFVANITGAPAGTLHAFYNGGTIVMGDISTIVTSCTITGSAFVIGTSADYNAINEENNSATSTPQPIIGFGFVSSTVIYILYRWQVSDNAGLSNPIIRNNLILKTFTQP